MTSPAGQPTAPMLAPAHAVARFISGGEAAPARQAFSEGPVTLVENFAPFLFEGEGALEAWLAAMRVHTAGLSDLAHEFGPAQDLARRDERVFFTLPTTWRGRSRGARFEETGGWAFVLEPQEERWRIRAYAWAVTGVRRL